MRFARRQHIQQMPAPPMPPLIRRQSIQHRAVGRLLQRHIQRRVHLQPRFVHRLRAELPLQLAPHLLHKPRRHAVRRGRQVQPQRRALRLACLRCRDRAILQHRVDHRVPPPERPLRIQNRRIRHRPLRQSGQQRSLRKVRSARRLAEVIIRPCLEAIDPMPQINLVAIEREDLLLGKAVLDLDGKKYLLQLPAERCGPATETGCAPAASSAWTRPAPDRAMSDRDTPPPARETDSRPSGSQSSCPQSRSPPAAEPAENRRTAPRCAAPWQTTRTTSMHVIQLGRRQRPVALQVRNLRQVHGVDQRQPARATPPPPPAPPAAAARP